MRQWTLAAGRALAVLGVAAGAIAGAAALAAGDAPADDGQWVRPARDLASTRYSGLDQINSRNVGQLFPHRAFAHATQREMGFEALVGRVAQRRELFRNLGV